MKLIHASGFDASERESFRVIVFSNITSAMQILFEIIEQLNIPFEHPNYSVSYFLSVKNFAEISVLNCFNRSTFLCFKTLNL